MDSSSVKPWHLWGSTATATVTSAGPNSQPTTSLQLARVHFKRPDTWTFALAAKLTSAPNGNLNVTAAFNLTFGVGRSTITLPRARVFSFDWTTTPTVPPVGRILFASTILNAASIAGGVVGSDGNVDTITAEDIQCNCDVGIVSLSSGEVCNVEVSAYFAPRTHVRPDWYGTPNEMRFNGERGGR